METERERTEEAEETEDTKGKKTKERKRSRPNKKTQQQPNQPNQRTETRVGFGQVQIRGLPCSVGDGGLNFKFLPEFSDGGWQMCPCPDKP